MTDKAPMTQAQPLTAEQYKPHPEFHNGVVFPSGKWVRFWQEVDAQDAQDEFNRLANLLALSESKREEHANALLDAATEKAKVEGRLAAAQERADRAEAALTEQQVRMAACVEFERGQREKAEQSLTAATGAVEVLAKEVHWSRTRARLDGNTGDGTLHAVCWAKSRKATDANPTALAAIRGQG